MDEEKCVNCQTEILENQFPKIGLGIQKSEVDEIQAHLFCNMECLEQWVTDNQLLGTEEKQEEELKKAEE